MQYFCCTLRAATLCMALAFGQPINAADAPQAVPRVAQCGDDLGNLELTIELCTTAIEFGQLDPENLAKAFHARGIAWAAQGNQFRAIGDFSVAIQFDPKQPGVHLNRALSLSETRERELAIEDYDVAIKLAPNDPAAYQGRAVEWTFVGDYPRALADYEQILRLDANSLVGHFGRGRVRFYGGNFAGAASDFERAHRIQPSMYTALWLYLARKRANRPAENALAEDAGSRGEGEWPAPLVGLYVGRLTAEVVQNAAAHSNLIRRRDRQCEAAFYVAHWHLLKGASAAASELFRAGEKLCRSTFVEHEGSIAELRRLQVR